MATNVCTNPTDGASTQAGQKTLRKRHQLRGGFECIFVTDPPKQVQTECSVCLCVLREPYLLDCCGYSFCKSCIEPIKSEKKPCPLCAVHFTTCIPDKRLQRTLNDFQVYCSHKEEGCEWAGQLANLAQHLNVNPLHEAERLSGCQLTSLDCKHCGECFQRRELVYHETSVCSQRPYSCEYCRDFKSTFEDVTSNHLSVCPDRPVPCSNGCGSSPLLKLLKDHLKECPLEAIECAFSYAGCSEKLLRKDMPAHITQSLAIHTSLMATSHQQEVVKLNQRISELEEQYKQSRAKVAELSIANQNLVAEVGQEAQDQRLKIQCTLRGEIKKAQAETKQEIEDRYKESRAEVAELRTANENLVAEVGQKIQKAKAETKQEITREVLFDIAALHRHGLVPFNVTMTGFEQKIRSNYVWYSPPFYTHPRGYKMCLKVDANGNGDGEGSHVSLFVYMMKGEYDDSLKWPFQSDITIQLLSQIGDDDRHRVNTLHVTDDTNIDKRVLKGERSAAGFGFHEFIRHRDLTPRYLKDDCLMFCVKEVKVKSV